MTMTPKMMLIQAQIDQKYTEMKTLGKYEAEKAYEIQQLIKQQSFLYDEVIMLELELEKLNKQPLNYAQKILREIGL